LRINSIGDAHCRPQYNKQLRDYLKHHQRKLCAQCKLRAKENVLRVLDCKESTCREALADVPQMVDHLDEACKNHFKQVIEFLDEIKAPYLLDPRLVRGLDYYTRTVFEISQEYEPEVLGEEKISLPGLALVAGGRYDGLVELLGGPATPAVGWAAGLERVVSAIKQAGISTPSIGAQPKIFLAQLGDLAKRKSLVLFEELRRAGIHVATSLGRDSIKSQLRMAHRHQVKFTLIIGQKEALDRTVILREMESGVQEVIALEEVVSAIKQRLKK